MTKRCLAALGLCLVASCQARKDSPQATTRHELTAASAAESEHDGASSPPALSALQAESDSRALAVMGFSEARVNLPLGSKNQRPLLLVFRSSSQDLLTACEAAKELDGGGAFVLCPSLTAGDTINREVEASTSALATAYPGRVALDNLSLVAWGDRALTALGMAMQQPRKYRRILLMNPTGSYMPQDFGHGYKAHGGERLLVACSTKACDAQAVHYLRDADEHGLQTRHFCASHPAELIDELMPHWAWFKKGAQAEAPVHEHNCPADLHP